MAKQPTLTSGLTSMSPSVRSTPTSQMGLLGALLDKIGIVPLGEQLAKEQNIQDKKLQQNIETAKRLSGEGLVPDIFGQSPTLDPKKDTLTTQLQSKPGGNIVTIDTELPGQQTTVTDKDAPKSGLDFVPGQKGVPTAGIDQDVIGGGAGVKEAEDEAMELGAMSDADIDYTDVGEPGSVESVKEMSEQEQLFANVMDDYNKMYGKGTGPEGAKSITDYKKDFAEATGIDISGEPDNRSALMALGLSLMQNRAGKGFNLSNILGEVGRAGEAALPKFEAAKREARAGQVAAGKFALQERKADTAAELAFAKERRLALMKLGTEARGYKQQYLLQELKNKASFDEALLKARADAIKNNKLDLKKSLEQEVQGVKGIKIQFGFDQTGSEKILNPVSAAKGLADGYGNILQAEAAITQLEEISKEIAASPSPILTVGSDRVKSLLAAIGVDAKSMFEDQTYEDATGKKVTIKGLSKEATASAIQDRLLAQYKRFLSQETGNGISNVDYQNLQRQIGEITLLTNPQERLLRLQELRKIFAVPKRRIESLFDQLNDKGFHANNDNYNRTQEVLFDVLKSSTPESFNKNFQLTDQGIKIVNVASL